MSNHKTWMIGEKEEVISITWELLSHHDIESICQQIHEIMIQEWYTRKLDSIGWWSSRAKHVFERYGFSTVRDIVTLSHEQIKCLEGCGYRTQQEIYSQFMKYNIFLPAWQPKTYQMQKQEGVNGHEM